MVDGGFYDTIPAFSGQTARPRIMNLLPLFPLVIPLFGSVLFWVWPRLRWSLAEKGVYLGALLLTVLSLLLVGGQVAHVPKVTISPEAMLWNEGLMFDYGALNTTLALALAIPLLLSEMGRPFERPRGRLRLLTVGLGVLACTSGNLLGICLAWGAIDLVNLFVLRQSAEGQIERRSGRWAITSFLSTLVLVVATVFLAVDRGHTRLDVTTASWTVLSWLALAAFLRLAPWPLQSNYASLTLAHQSLVLGGGLWLRLAPGLVAGGGRLEPSLAALLILASSLLALVASRDGGPYLLLPGTGLLVLAPLSGSPMGKGAGILVLVSLSLLCGYWEMLPWLERSLPDALSRYARAPLLLGLAGAPLAIGFGAHLSALTALSTPWPGAWLVVGLGLTLLDAALWRRWLGSQEIEAQEEPSRVERYLTWGAAGALCLAILAVGVAPRLLSGTGGEPFGWGELMAAPGAWWRAVAVSLLPLALGFGLAWSLARRTSILGEIVAWLGTFVELDWLYAGIEGGFARIGRWSAFALAQVEGGLALVWTICWWVALALLMVGDA